MMPSNRTAIVTGASQGIGAAVAQAFLDRGDNVVATSRQISKTDLAPSPRLALVDGDISEPATAERIVQTAIQNFGTINHLVNNAGVLIAKPFIDYTADDFHRLVATNLDGFLLITQLAVKQMLAQGNGGSVTTITAALAENPILGFPASIAMATKGGLNAATLSLANEFAKSAIRFNAVAPGTVDTPLQTNRSKAYLDARSPMGTISDAKDIADAVIYLANAKNVTGEILHVDGGAHVGRW